MHFAKHILSGEKRKGQHKPSRKTSPTETLRKLLTDQIKISERTNLVQARKFREALEKAMLSYTNKTANPDTAEMIAQLQHSRNGFAT